MQNIARWISSTKISKSQYDFATKNSRNFFWNVTVDPRFSCYWECVSRRRNEVKEEANPTKRTSQGGTRAKCKSRNYEISCLTRFHYPLDRSTAFWKEREKEREIVLLSISITATYILFKNQNLQLINNFNKFRLRWYWYVRMMISMFIRENWRAIDFSKIIL